MAAAIGTTTMSVSLQKVLDFLGKLKVQIQVVERFKEEKIDKEAVLLMSSEELEQMGLQAKGDQAKLRAFCRREDQYKSSEREEKMQKLKQIIEEGKGARRSTKPVAASEKTPLTKKMPKATLKFEFRWHHAKAGGEYKLVRIGQGGGVRAKDICRFATSNECLKEAQELFFPNGKSTEGDLDEMVTNLADFKGDVIDLMDSFTAEGYKKTHGFHTPRLILLTKQICIQLSDSSPQQSGDESDEDLEMSVWDSTTSHAVSVDHPDPIHDSLIGTSCERKKLLDSIKDDYEASLSADKAKDRKEKLRADRENRAPALPDKTSPHLTISVRHPSLGIKSRSFTPSTKVLGVYDWAGYLSSSPEHFSLMKSFPREVVYPEEDASIYASSTLNMIMQDDPVPLSPEDGEIHFYNNYGAEVMDCDSTLEDDNLKSEEQSKSSKLINEKVQMPSQLMEDGMALSTQEKHAIHLLECLESKRKSEKEKLENHDIVEINRGNCFQELFALYKREDILQYNVPLLFKDENAVGEGVSREVYSVFWDIFVTRYCEGVTQFALGLSPAFSPDDYLVLGRIITHQFIQTGIIPLQLSESIIQLAINGSVSDECLLQSFLMLLYEKEREVIHQALQGKSPFPTDDLIDILSHYNSGILPSPSNFKRSILQVAETELITKPYMCIMKLREGMGKFWTDVSTEDISSLYSCCTPTIKNIVNGVYFEDIETPQEGKVQRWLIRYLKNLEVKMGARFVRFCTGSELLLPDKRIKVNMEVMPELAMRPKAKICFGILVIPKNYHSYAQMRDNIDFFLNNPQAWDLSDI